MREAEKAARIMYHTHRNDKRIWQPYKCRCGFFLTGTTAHHDKDVLHGRMRRRARWRDQTEDDDVGESSIFRGLLSDHGGDH